MFGVVAQEVESRVLPVLTAAAAAGAVVDLQDVFRRFAALRHARHRRGAAAVEGQAPAQLESERELREATKLVDEHAAAMTRCLMIFCQIKIRSIYAYTCISLSRTYMQVKKQATMALEARWSLASLVSSVRTCRDTARAGRNTRLCGYVPLCASVIRIIPENMDYMRTQQVRQRGVVPVIRTPAPNQKLVMEKARSRAGA